MKKIDDKSVDFIFTDPPYNMTNNSWECETNFELNRLENKQLEVRR